MKLQHTPGPWVVYDDDFIRSNRTTICQFFNRDDESFTDSDEQKANARLIAAAPEMLEWIIRHRKVIAPTTYRVPVDDIIERATGLKIEEVLEANNE